MSKRYKHTTTFDAHTTRQLITLRDHGVDIERLIEDAVKDKLAGREYDRHSNDDLDRLRQMFGME